MEPPADSPDSLARHLADEAATLVLGQDLGRALVPGLVIFLSGELGAGKTTFARGILRGLGYPGKVKSPSFTLVELYTFSRLYLYHFDFYRLDDPHGWSDAGLREYFRPDAVCLVEWPEKADGTLPPPDLAVHFTVVDDGRDIRIVAYSAAGRRCLSNLSV
jgi:tRNA threonylcarbamoyladenosine biosynthesis protein TsaE